MSTDPESRIGTELAGFRIESVIGRGGMGVVYGAEQLRYGRKVALKVLAPELSHDRQFRERFEQEWRTAARIEHPSIVPIYEAGEAEDGLYIAMRYIDGTDLRALLGRTGRLPVGRALDILAQVAEALDTVHTHGLVHRDVKPANILVASGEGYEHAYLGDFGVAKQVRTESGLTQTGAFIGTVDYAAPEQLEGKAVDARADIYALGCVLYQCLTGLRPFEKGSDAATISAHLFEPPPSAHAKRPDLPPELDDVIARALAKPPADRFPSCRELVRAARDVLGGRQPAAAAAGQAGRPPTGRRRFPRARPLATRPRGRRAASPESAGRRLRTLALVAIVAAVVAVAAVLAIVLTRGGSDSEDDGGDTAAGASAPGTTATAVEPPTTAEEPATTVVQPPPASTPPGRFADRAGRHGLAGRAVGGRGRDRGAGGARRVHVRGRGRESRSSWTSSRSTASARPRAWDGGSITSERGTEVFDESISTARSRSTRTASRWSRARTS